MADPIVHITGGIPDSGTGNITTLGMTINAIGSTTPGQSGPLMMGAVTTAAPVYANGQTNPISIDTNGALRVNVTGGGGGGTFSSFGTTFPTIGTAVGAEYLSSPPTLTSGQMVSLQTNASGALKIDGSAITQPVSGTFWQATQPVSGTVAATQSGTWTVQPGNTANTTPWLVMKALTAASNGLTSTRVVAAATTNATSLKASAGNIAAIDLFNVAAYAVFLKLYNKASAPTVGTDTPVWTIPLPASGGFSVVLDWGEYFSTGIAFAITKLQADSDTTALVAGDVTGRIKWV